MVLIGPFVLILGIIAIFRYIKSGRMRVLAVVAFVALLTVPFYAGTSGGPEGHRVSSSR